MIKRHVPKTAWRATCIPNEGLLAGIGVDPKQACFIRYNELTVSIYGNTVRITKESKIAAAGDDALFAGLWILLEDGSALNRIPGVRNDDVTRIEIGHDVLAEDLRFLSKRAQHNSRGQGSGER